MADKYSDINEDFISDKIDFEAVNADLDELFSIFKNHNCTYKKNIKGKKENKKEHARNSNATICKIIQDSETLIDDVDAYLYGEEKSIESQTNKHDEAIIDDVDAYLYGEDYIIDSKKNPHDESKIDEDDAYLYGEPTKIEIQKIKPNEAKCENESIGPVEKPRDLENSNNLSAADADKLLLLKILGDDVERDEIYEQLERMYEEAKPASITDSASSNLQPSSVQTSTVVLEAQSVLETIDLTADQKIEGETGQKIKEEPVKEIKEDGNNRLPLTKVLNVEQSNGNENPPTIIRIILSQVKKENPVNTLEEGEIREDEMKIQPCTTILNINQPIANSQNIIDIILPEASTSKRNEEYDNPLKKYLKELKQKKYKKRKSRRKKKHKSSKSRPSAYTEDRISDSHYRSRSRYNSTSKSRSRSNSGTCSDQSYVSSKSSSPSSYRSRSNSRTRSKYRSKRAFSSRNDKYSLYNRSHRKPSSRSRSRSRPKNNSYSSYSRSRSRRSRSRSHRSRSSSRRSRSKSRSHTPYKTILGVKVYNQSHRKSRSRSRSSSSKRSHSKTYKKRRYSSSSSSSERSRSRSRTHRKRRYSSSSDVSEKKDCIRRSSSSSPIRHNAYNSSDKNISSTVTKTKAQDQGTSSSFVSQRTFQQELRHGNNLLTRQAVVTTSYREELRSFKNAVSLQTNTSDNGSDNLDELDLRVYKGNNIDVTSNRPDKDPYHTFYIHPTDVELYKTRYKNTSLPVQALHEICVKCRWKFPIYLNLPSECGFKFALEINKHKFITGKTGQQKKQAKAETAMVVLQWLKIIDIT